MASPRLIDKTQCVGCGLCVHTCLEKAIRLTADSEGFLAPMPDTSICSKCKVCSAVCSLYDNTFNYSEKVTKVFAAQATDKNILIEATAGGFFPVLARYIISNGGVVFGAGYDSNMKVIHFSANKIEDISKFNGSKYVQSDISNALLCAKKLLNKKITVLFSGTPCQINALIKFCDPTELQYLYTLDVICFGVPSPKLFNFYLKSIEKEQGGKVIDYRFRDKHKFGWSHTTLIKIVKSDGKETIIEDPNFSHFSYYRMFGRRDCFRKSCYNCKFNTIKRISDLTTGNFWGIEKLSKTFECNLGVSMVLVNTEKGMDIFNKLKDQFYTEERTLKNAIDGNEALVKQTPYPSIRDIIYECLNKQGFESLVHKYYPDSFYGKIMRKIRILCADFFSKFHKE